MADNEVQYENPANEKEDFEIDISSESDIELEVVDDTPEEDRGRKPLSREVEDPTDEEIEQYGDKVKSRIKELTHARHDERRAREAAEREREEAIRFAQQLIDEHNRLKVYVNSGQETYAETIKKQAETELEMARRKLREAQESYDTDAIIEAQEALADAKIKIVQAQSFKPTPLQATETPVYSEQSVQNVSQPDDRTLRWQQKNQWFGAPGYEDVTSFALGLHQKLVNNGVSPQHNPDEYYGRIDARLREIFPEIFVDSERRSAAPSKKPATVVAPAGRTTSGKKVQLTKTQLAIAAKFNLTPQQYAAAYVKTLEK